MKTMTLNDVKNLPPLCAEEIDEVKKFQNTDFSDCPIQTEAELAQFMPWNETKSEWHTQERVMSVVGR